MVPMFEISHALEGHACVARLSGDIDTAIVPELRTELDHSIEAGCVNLVLDLTHVTYADSSALGLLVWLDHRLRPCDGRVLLAGANRDVSRILELSGLASFATSITVAEDVETALAGLDTDVVLTDPLWREDICIPADIDRLAEVRDKVSVLVVPLGFIESAVFDIKVALGEALANAVRHGAPDSGGRVCVSVTAFSDRVVLEVSDNGEGFDGVHLSSDDLYAPSGRGIMFMRALMDDVAFEPAPGGGTLVRLTKRHRGGIG
jgi:serine/threonine-protein kinase RsbW